MPCRSARQFAGANGQSRPRLPKSEVLKMAVRVDHRRNPNYRLAPGGHRAMSPPGLGLSARPCWRPRQLHEGTAGAFEQGRLPMAISRQSVTVARPRPRRDVHHGFVPNGHGQKRSMARTSSVLPVPDLPVTNTFLPLSTRLSALPCWASRLKSLSLAVFMFSISLVWCEFGLW